ncbi:hypothetical protein [Nocardioides sp.]|uniref:hypothetical protein n=1 Tax=Nocardioides sp. TaxID=35761 RepID=UPI002B26F927|nr:hypothetical protein [Nocardioides sp.]
MSTGAPVRHGEQGKARRHLSYANVSATLALVVALSGTAYAANTVRSKDIVNGQVKTADLGKAAVATSKIKKNAVTTSRIKKNAVTTNRIKSGAVAPDDLNPATFPHFIVSDYDSSNTNTSISGGLVAVLTVELTTHVESHVMVTSNVEVDADGGNNDDAFCYISGSETGAPTGDISQRVTVDISHTNLARNNIANHGNAVVPAGTHAFRVFCGVNVGGQTIEFDSGDVSAIAVPVDPDNLPGPPAVEPRAGKQRGVEGH